MVVKALPILPISDLRTKARELLARVKEEPVVITDVREDVSEVTLKHSLGRCLLRATPEMPYEIMLSNSAADSRL